jgi:uncharacterized OB-fold protein
LLPPIDEAFWGAAREHEFVLQQCAACGESRFPPRPRCPNCGGSEAAWVKASGRGTVVSYVVVHQKLHPVFDPLVPYTVALVQLAEGPRMLALLPDAAPGDAHVDAEVQVIFQRIEEGLVIPRMRLVVP